MLSLLSLFVSSVTFAPEWTTPEWTAVPAAAINASATAATSAFFAEDEGAFTTATNALRRDLASAAPLTANDVAAIHLALALDALYPRDERALDAHLRAVLALRPTFAFTAKVAPPGGPLDRAMRAARGPLAHTPFPVGAPCGGKLPLTIDGEPATGWSGERAAIAQIDAPGSAPTVTILLLPGMHDPFAGVACPTGLYFSSVQPATPLDVGLLNLSSGSGSCVEHEGALLCSSGSAQVPANPTPQMVQLISIGTEENEDETPPHGGASFPPTWGNQKEEELILIGRELNVRRMSFQFFSGPDAPIGVGIDRRELIDIAPVEGTPNIE